MYERHFGLRTKPFQLNPDPEFFFGSRGHKRAMAYLKYGLQEGEGFIVITGEVGAGKTTLLRSLLRDLEGEAIVAAQIVSTQVDADDLLRLVAAAFGLSVEGLDKAAILTGLHRYFEGINEDGRRALLIVDEAQNLSPRAVEELRMLSNFQVGTRSVLQSFLVGQPEFREVMQRPEMRQLKQRVIASHHLGPLGPEESRLYIEHRLRHAGWTGVPAFADEAFAPIHSASEGVPRRINLLCDRLLLSAYLSDSQVVGVDDVRAIAGEMEQELGGTGATQRATLSGALPLPMGRTAASDVTGIPNDRIAGLEDRVATLEASNELLLNLIKRVLRILRGTSNEPSRNDARPNA